jgi:MFS family permease
MVFVLILNFIDRQILSILSEDLKRDLNLTDTDLGFLYGTAFAIFYAVFGVPLGRLVDSWKRGRLMAIGLALWSTMTTLSGFSTSYAQLAIARIGVGIGEASASPAAYSLLADYFPKKQRGVALSIYSAGIYVGIGLSVLFGGAIASGWDHAFASGSAPLGLKGWQAAVILVGLPGIPVALIVSRLREPRRGAIDGIQTAADAPGAWRRFLAEMATIIPPLTFWSVSRFPGALRTNVILAVLIAFAAAALIYVTGDESQWIAYGVGIYALFSWTQMLRATDRPAYQLIFATPATVLGFVGFGLLAVVGYSYSFWVPPFAMRELGITKTDAGLYLGLPGAVASAAGVVLGGLVSDIWKSRDPRGRVFVCMLSLALPPPLIWWMFQQSDFATFALISPAIYLLSSLWVGSGVAAFQDLVMPRMRGVVGAITVLASTMIGLALGPYMVGKISTETGSLLTGVYSLLAVAPIGLIVLYQMCRLTGEAEATKQERAAAYGEPANGQQFQ